MSFKSLIKNENFPTVMSDFFKPWNDWFDTSWTKSLNVPAVNITENEKEYKLSVAAPGLKKDDISVDVEGNIMTISSEKEESKEKKEEKYTRKEYNYSSFSRSFTLPNDVSYDKIDARYQDGVLNVVLPRKEAAKKTNSKSISVK